MFQPEFPPASFERISRRLAQTVPQRRPVAVATDPLRRPVLLTAIRWDHIATRHPELRGSQDLVMRAITTPVFQQARPDGEEWFYIPGGPSAWIKVVVAYSGDVGQIITAFPRRATP